MHASLLSSFGPDGLATLSAHFPHDGMLLDRYMARLRTQFLLPSSVSAEQRLDLRQRVVPILSEKCVDSFPVFLSSPIWSGHNDIVS